jgi:hypothetical protein
VAKSKGKTNACRSDAEPLQPSVFGSADVLVPWKGMGTVIKRESDSPAACQRYCHVFEEGEVAALVHSLCGGTCGGQEEGTPPPDQARSLPWAQVEDEYYDQGFWCVVVVKTARK